MTSANRWKRLSELLASLERCVEATGRLDAHGSRDGDTLEASIIEGQLRSLEFEIDHHLDLLTVDLLRAQLIRRKTSAPRSPIVDFTHSVSPEVKV